MTGHDSTVASSRGSGRSVTPAQAFLLPLSNCESGNMGRCQVCKEDRESVVELFTGEPDEDRRPHDRLVCPQCLALGAIAAKVGATPAELPQH
jgi:hypothetical protein